MGKYQFITSQFENGYHRRYYVEAESFQKACQKMAALGLLKGHLLRRFDGKWEACEYLCEGMHPCTGIPDMMGGKQVFLCSRSGGLETLQIIRLLSGLYTCHYWQAHTMKGTSYEEGLTLLEAWSKAKNFCRNAWYGAPADPFQWER